MENSHFTWVNPSEFSAQRRALSKATSVSNLGRSLRLGAVDHIFDGMNIYNCLVDQITYEIVSGWWLTYPSEKYESQLG